MYTFRPSNFDIFIKFIKNSIHIEAHDSELDRLQIT